jgi:hypothetical protein
MLNWLPQNSESASCPIPFLFLLLGLVINSFAIFCPKNACQVPKPPNPSESSNIRVAF